MCGLDDLIECVQDKQSMYSTLLLIQEALETGKMPKSFLVYNDTSIAEVVSNITEVMSSKYGIEVPESE